MSSVFDQWKHDTHTTTKKVDGAPESSEFYKMIEKMFREKFISEDEIFKYFHVGVDLGSKPDMSYTKPILSAKKQEKIKKLQAFINDPVATPNEKENAKRLIEKIKAGV
jgi:hypothetical protein